MTEFVVSEASNLEAWEDARSGGTTTVRPAHVAVPATPAAQEILNDSDWADKIRRALADSEAGHTRSLDEHRKNL